jgi:hypothetical protein
MIRARDGHVVRGGIDPTAHFQRRRELLEPRLFRSAADQSDLHRASERGGGAQHGRLVLVRDQPRHGEEHRRRRLVPRPRRETA